MIKDKFDRKLHIGDFVLMDGLLVGQITDITNEAGTKTPIVGVQYRTEESTYNKVYTTYSFGFFCELLPNDEKERNQVLFLRKLEQE
jgi:hypothetical protein